MNTKFFINGRCYKTPCKTVLNADTFRVEFFTGEHIVEAFVSDKCYFESIDNIALSDIKCDFYFGRNYHKPKEFLSKLYETFVSFLNTSISVKKCPLCKNTDEVLDRILEIVTASDTVSADQSETAEKKEHISVEHFERLTRTLYKSLFKAIGLEEARKIPFIISNNMVFFNYKGRQYKYYPSQCKIFKKCGGKYQRINWKDFAEENIPEGQKQNSGRSPPFTPDIRSLTINYLK